MKLVTAPNNPNYDSYLWHTEPSLFLAGTISGSANWQDTLIDLLKDSDLWILNPRRPNFDITDKSVTIQQIEWEHYWLERVKAISFWFSNETVAPITLFELGKELGRNRRKLFIGAHPDYSRLLDLNVQLALENPNIKLCLSLEELAEQIKEGVANS